jgi:hypothetical protein
MTDEPTDNPPDQLTPPASQPTSTPPTQPTEPSGTGFAAINLTGQQAPSGPLPGQAPGYANAYQPPAPPTYNSDNPPPPPPPSAPVYQYDYSRTPNAGGGAPVLLIAGLAFVLVLVVGVGAMLAFGIGPFARQTPAPTLVARPTPTAHPITPAPSSSAAATATALASPTDGAATPSPTPVASGDVTDALLSHIPLPIEPTCFVDTGHNEIVAVAVCSADEENIKLTYFQYDSHDSMFNAYEGFRTASEIEPDSGDCNDPASWPAEAGFNIGGQLAGRWLCTEALGPTTIYWTDDRLNIMAQATQTVVDYERLVDFWIHESGPNLEPFSN